MSLPTRAATLACATLLLARPLFAEGPAVVTDIPPVASLVSMVAGVQDASTVLLPPGTSPHALSLKPSQARSLAEAALVIWIGPELTPGLEHQIEALAPDAQSIALDAAPGTLRLNFREGGLIESDDHDHDPGHEHDEEPPFDPHLWLAPDNAVLWLDVIASALAERDPENAATYRQNATDGAARIRTAEEAARSTLAPARGKPLGVSHDAFQYVEHSFGLSVIGALSDGDDAAPGAARVAELHDHFAEATPACILIEPGTDPDLLATVADPSIPRAEIDVLGSALPQGADLYPALIEDIATRIAACVGN
ncbi:zinc ABC transporter substrate-binding protein [Sagittula sp. S175]|uniref:zinc ABC transporter substrate-binding protein n=1 Tax=Sagittula sp. S175 TaxID=3415129 RepID=UPI003C7ED519